MDFDRWRDESDDEYGDDFNFDSDVSLSSFSKCMSKSKESEFSLEESSFNL